MASSGDWLREPLKHVIESQQFDKETLSEILLILLELTDMDSCAFWVMRKTLLI